MELYVVARQLAIVPKMTNKLIVLLFCCVHMDSELTTVSSSMLVFRHWAVQYGSTLALLAHIVRYAKAMRAKMLSQYSLLRLTPSIPWILWVRKRTFMYYFNSWWFNLLFNSILYVCYIVLFFCMFDIIFQYCYLYRQLWYYLVHILAGAWFWQSSNPPSHLCSREEVHWDQPSRS